MSKQQAPQKKWSLALVELCPSPGTLIDSLQAIVLSNGGSILYQNNMHPYSAAISFELSPEQVIEIYALLLRSCEHLSANAHEQLALLLQHARYASRAASIETSLTLYSNCCGEEMAGQCREQFRSLDGESEKCLL